MKQFRTIFKFEYTNYVRTKGFVIVTAVFLALVIAVTSLPAITDFIGGLTGGTSGSIETDMESTTGYETAVSDEAGAEGRKKALIADHENVYTDEILMMYLPMYDWVRAGDLSGAEENIKNDEYELAVMIDGLNFEVYEKAESIFSGGSGGVISTMIKDVFQTSYLSERGLTPEEARTAMYAFPTGSVTIVGKDYSQTFWLSYVMIMLMYMMTMLYGQFVSTSVITEKSSKAMELLITSAKPFQLMLGKVIGVGSAGLTQFGLILTTALAFFSLNRDGWAAFNPAVAGILDMSISLDLLAIAILFFLFGFFSFSFILAGFASTVSRMEEANTVILVPMMMFVAAFMASIFGSMTPEAGWVRVCSFVPFLSPMVMFMRICVTEVPILEILAAVAVNAVTILGAAFVSSRIYRVGVMLYGKKPNFKDIISYVMKA